MKYITKRNNSIYEYSYDESSLSISVNGERWGTPQGCRFVIALLEDIEQLQEENASLRYTVKKLTTNKGF